MSSNPKGRAEKNGTTPADRSDSESSRAVVLASARRTESDLLKDCLSILTDLTVTRVDKPGEPGIDMSYTVLSLPLGHPSAEGLTRLLTRARVLRKELLEALDV